MSVITKIEVLRFNTTIPTYKILENFISICNVITIDDPVVDKTIELCKLYKIKLPDAIIAATAAVNNLMLLTRNVNDFKSINRLNIINPHEI
ncbi:MAG: type II toxin-antitoxin system VapC family toxin [Ginsengibacter sp.]